jgi:hypothetical protein
MNKNKWGKHIWYSFHIIALNYPQNSTNIDKMNYKNFYLNFGNVLPCDKCKINYQKHIKNIPIDNYLNNNIDLFKWTIEVHNNVNKDLGKKELSYNEAFRIYHNNNYCKIRIIIKILILIILCIFIFKRIY